MSNRQEYSLVFDPALDQMVEASGHDYDVIYHRRASQMHSMLGKALDAAEPAVAARCVRMAERYAEMAIYRIPQEVQ